MAELREVVARFREVLQRTSPTLRFALFVLPPVLLAAGFAVWDRSPARSSEVLLDGQQLNDGQLGAIVQGFAKAKMSEFSIRDRRVYVPPGQAAQYLAALAENDALPKGLQDHTSLALQQRGFLESERDFRQRLRHARERDLAAAICAMDGIQDAFVQFDETERRGLQTQQLVTASVAVLPSKGAPIDPTRIRTIRQLVASAKAGLEPQDVHLTDLRSGRAYLGNSGDQNEWQAVEFYWQRKQELEQHWQQKLERVLHFIPAVEVAVDLELPAPPQREEAADPPGADIVPATWEPRRLDVSVGVPRTYLMNVWRSRAADRPDQRDVIPTSAQLAPLQTEMTDRIRHAVLALAPVRLDAAASTVTVTTFDDVVARAGSPAVGWLAHWSVRQQTGLAIVLAGLLGLVAVQLQTKRGRRRRALGMAQPKPRRAEMSGDDCHPPSVPIPFPDTEEQQLRASLADLVRDDPGKAAKILNRWIARAG